MNTTEPIEIARECGAEIYHEGEPGHDANYPMVQFMTNELQQFAQRIEQPHKQRIAELEKDCEILQTNYDAARQASRFTADVADQAMADLKAAEKQIEQLREALEEALRYKRADEKLVDIINGVGQQQQKPKHGRQA